MNISLEKFKRLKDLYLSHHLVCVLTISTFLLFLSSLWHPFIFIMLAYLLVSMTFFNIRDIFCCLFYNLVFSGYLILFIGVAAYTFILLMVKYIIDVVKKREKIYVLPLSLTGAIILIFSLIFYEVNDYGAMQGVLIIAIFLLAYLLFCYRKQIDAEACFKYLAIGLIVSLIVGFILYAIPIAKMFSFKDWGYGMVGVKQRLFHDDGTYKRLLLLNFHENHLCAICVAVLSFIVYYFLSKNNNKSLKQIIFYSFAFIIAAAIGILTLSKAFIILFVLILIFALIMAVVVYKKKSLKIVIPTLVVAIVLCIIFRNKISTIIERFLFKDSSGNLFDKITTGRMNIWKQFLAETFSTPLKALFGVGIFTKDIVDIGPHNLYIAVLYRFGIFGIIAIGFLVWSYLREINYKLKCSFISIFPLLILLLLAMQEACIDERLFFIFLSMLISFQSNNDQLQKIEINDIIENEKSKELVSENNTNKIKTKNSKKKIGG